MFKILKLQKEYRTSQFERQVKRGHYDHERSKKWVSNQCQATEMVLIRENTV